MGSIKRNSHLSQVNTVAGPSDPALVRLADLIRTYAPHDGRFELRITWGARYSGVTTEHGDGACRSETVLVHHRARSEERDAGAGSL